MRGIWRPLLIVVLALMVPILPFFAFGRQLEDAITGWLDPPPAPATIAALTIAVLATDVFLPVPSSVVSTVAGSQLGVVAATAASWLGMMAGAVFAFYLARKFGRPLAVRFSSADDLERLDRLEGGIGVWLLIVTRALPILAEAAVLLLGATAMRWRPFLIAAGASNLGIALVYSALGQAAQSHGELPLALGASIALPLAATIVARVVLRKPVADRAAASDPPASNGSPS